MKIALWIGFCVLAAWPVAAQDRRKTDRPNGRPAPEARGEGRNGRAGPVRERLRERLRERADRNGDDRISPEEIRALRAKVAELRAKMQAFRDRRDRSGSPESGERRQRADRGDRGERGERGERGRRQGAGDRPMMNGRGPSPELRERVRRMMQERMQGRGGEGRRSPRD